MHNKKLNISPAWIFRTANGELFEPVLFRLLEGIRDTGKLTAAATNAGISYRHAWNLLNRGGHIIGLPLVIMRKGQGSQLSPPGRKTAVGRASGRRALRAANRQHDCRTE